MAVTQAGTARWFTEPAKNSATGSSNPTTNARQKSRSPSFSVSPRTKPRSTGTTSRNAMYVYRYQRCGTLLWTMPFRSPKAVRGDPVSIASTQ